MNAGRTDVLAPAASLTKSHAWGCKMASRIVRQQQSDPTTVRAAIYARVSTVNNGQDPAMQTRELLEYCERRGWTVAAEFIDLGVSGAKDRRPQLDKLMADAHRRK